MKPREAIFSILKNYELERRKKKETYKSFAGKNL